MRRLRDFESVVALLSEEEMDEMQAAIDARREARTPGVQPTGGAGCNVPGLHPRPTQQRRPDHEKEEAAMEKAEGKMKEAYGALVGDEAKKAEGRALQRKAEAQAEAEQRERTRQAEAEAKEAERERDRRKGRGGLLGDVGDNLPKL